jgi:enoyl-CoA hydratase/carnithine racemase
METKIVNEIIAERRGNAGLITLNRPKALNALSLPMILRLLEIFRAWQNDDSLQLVAMRGTNKIGKPGSPDSHFGNFCAGGDIRFFHQAFQAGDPALDDFFTQEYTLNHLIQSYAKPVIAFMDGVVMGGGMGLSQGAHLRVVTERTKIAMPETNIGLFPDVGGGYFLSRRPGHSGEYLALTGNVIGADEALGFGLADVKTESARQVQLWEELGSQSISDAASVDKWAAMNFVAAPAHSDWAEAELNTCFAVPDMSAIMQALKRAANPQAKQIAATLRKRSPLMLHVTLEQIRRARSMSLADELRMERDMVHHCFYRVGGAPSETIEGIRALAIDKDYQPKWQPPRIEDVTQEQVTPFFVSPWPEESHPLRAL